MRIAGEKANIIVNPDQYLGLIEIQDKLEMILQPIQHSSLTARLNTFASTFHFAFGSASDREVAIASWASVLADYPEWALKQALEDVLISYHPDKKRVLTPAIVIERVRYYLGGCFDLQKKVRRVFRDGVIFKSYNEYLKWKESENNKAIDQERARQEAVKKVKQVVKKQNDKVEFEKQEAVKKEIAIRRKQKQDIEKAAKILKNNKQLNRLWQEYKIIAEEYINDLSTQS